MSKIKDKFNEMSSNPNSAIQRFQDRIKQEERLKIWCHSYFDKWAREKYNCTTSSFVSDEKNDGVQFGNVFTFKIQKNSFKFFVKTHQHGLTSNTAANNSTKCADMREIFVYKFFELFCLGPEVHFFFDLYNKNNFYIASKDLGDKYKTFYELADDEKSNCDFLNKFNTSSLYDSFIVLDLLSIIFLLRDLLTNYGNYGFIDEQLKVLDFHIKVDDFNQDINIAKRFLNIESSLSCLSDKVEYFRNSKFNNKQYRQEIAKKFMSERLNSLRESIKQAKKWTGDYFEEYLTYFNLKDGYDFENFDTYINLIYSNITNITSLGDEFKI